MAVKIADIQSCDDGLMYDSRAMLSDGNVVMADGVVMGM